MCGLESDVMYRRSPTGLMDTRYVHPFMSDICRNVTKVCLLLQHTTYHIQCSPNPENIPSQNAIPNHQQTKMYTKRFTRHHDAVETLPHQTNNKRTVVDQ